MLMGVRDGGLKSGDWAVCVEDGVLKIAPAKFGQVREYGYKNAIHFKKAFGARYFGDEMWLIGVDSDFMKKVLFECADKTEEEVVDVCGKYREKREERKSKEARNWEKWQKLREKFDGVVIGIDSKIDVWDAGFSVRVLFGSDVTFAAKREFLKEHRVEFVKWVMHEVAGSRSAMRKVGDMAFYRPVEIVNLRGHEVEVKFEVKKEVA